MERPLMIIGADSAAERVVEQLEGVGYELVTSTPEKVVGDLARHKPKVLLFELEEDADGVDDLIQRIQATAYGAVVPIVFFGPPPGPNPAEVVVLGGDLFLASPVDSAELLACVRRLGGEPPKPKAQTPAPEPPDATAANPGPASSGAKQTDAPARTPTLSMAKGTDVNPPKRSAKFPEPGDLDDLEDLSALDKLAMPWDELPEGPDAKAAEQDPLEDEPDLLKQAMERDLMLDPREMALTITTMVPEMRAPIDDLPPASDVTAAPRTQTDEPPLPQSDQELSAVDAIVQEFMAPGGDGDTVAVRIRRTINAFEEQIVAPEPEPADEGLTPPPAPLERRPSGTLPARTGDEIDLDALDALDVDAASGVYGADPERVLQRFEDELGTVAPPPPADPLLTPGGTEVSHPGRLPPEPEPLDVDAEAPAEPPKDDGTPEPFTPAPRNAYTEARKVPAPEEPNVHGTIADPGAPLASPYDLPPVVSSQGFEYVDPRGERRDVVDTVPGRRTAVHFHALDGPVGSPKPQVEDRPAPVDTQPAKGLGTMKSGLPKPMSEEPEAVSTPPPATTPAPVSAPDRPPKEVPVRLREGSLSDQDPAHLLQAIAFHELDGALEITAEDARYEIFFSGGVPRLAQSSRTEDRMLEMLRRQGRITEEQYRECVLEVTEGRRAGAVLLDHGWIKPAELIPTVRLHLEDLVYAVFALEEGSFRFDDEQPLPDEIVYLEQRPAALLLEGVRRKYTPGRIIRLTGSESIVPVKPPDADEGRLAGAELSGRDWRIIDAMDGRSTVTGVAEKLDAPPHDVWALAWGLSCLGLVKLQNKAEAPASDDRHPEESPQPPPPEPPREHDFELDVKRVVSRHELVREGDYFACLGAPPGVSPHELRRAYDQARSQFDPEGLHPNVRAEYGGELQEIRTVIEEAYSVLRDDALREAYRLHMERSATAGESQ